jgi:hypothetical protein
MTEPDEFLLLCHVCGTRNPRSAEVCSRCGYDFIGGNFVAKSPRARMFSGFGLLVLGEVFSLGALLAFCWVISRERFVPAILALVLLLPLAFAMPLVLQRFGSEGRSLDFADFSEILLKNLSVGFLNVVAMVVAFVLTLGMLPIFALAVVTITMSISLLWIARDRRPLNSKVIRR